jgi:cytochrome oxidase Cu insertion factor (SCO1/SenC/PrrC family)
MTVHRPDLGMHVQIQEHFDEAVRENENIFLTLDPDKDGYVTWKEYLKKFLIDKGQVHVQADNDWLGLCRGLSML